MKTITKTIEAYTFNELAGRARERALEKIGSFNTCYTWHDYTLNDIKDELTANGFKDPEVNYSGFWSQGDGLSFTCTGTDIEKLFNQIDLPKTVQRHRKLFENILNVSLERTSSHYSHERTVRIDVGYNEYTRCHSPHLKRLNAIVDQLTSLLDDLRIDLCSKYYKQLEQEYEYLTSEEVVQETCTSNEYLFNSEGDLV